MNPNVLTYFRFHFIIFSYTLSFSVGTRYISSQFLYFWNWFYFIKYIFLTNIKNYYIYFLTKLNEKKINVFKCDCIVLYCMSTLHNSRYEIMHKRLQLFLVFCLFYSASHSTINSLCVPIIFCRSRFLFIIHNATYR